MIHRRPSSNPNGGFKSISPAVAPKVFGAALGNRPHKFINAESVASSGLFGAFLLFLLDGPVRRLRNSFFLLLDSAVALNLFALGMGNSTVTARRQK